jgi:type I restriction enzyme S subunit
MALKRLSRVSRGASPRPIDDPKYFDDEGECAWVRISDVTASKTYLTDTTQRLSELGASLSIRIHPGELFLSIAGSVGKPCISKIEACIHDGFVYFPELTLKYRKFLYYVFEAGEIFKGLGKFGTQLNLNTETVGGVAIDVPSPEIAAEIVNFLDDKTARIDALIEEKEKLQSALTELRTARIWSAVTGQGLENRQVVPDAAWSSNVPTHWKVTPVGKFARLQRGFDLPDETRTQGSVPVMSGGGVSGWHDVARVKGPGVVTGRYGTIGVLHYVEEDFWPLNTSLFVDNFFGNNPKYAYYVLSFLPWDMLGGKSAVPGVNRNDVHPLSVGVPPRAEQDEIVSRLDAQFAEFDLLAAHVTEHIARLREYRSSLISAAVTGQLDMGGEEH